MLSWRSIWRAAHLRRPQELGFVFVKRNDAFAQHDAAVEVASQAGLQGLSNSGALVILEARQAV
jgi:hypothetical protein